MTLLLSAVLLIGSIDFFALGGSDPERLRRALPVKPGQSFEPAATEAAIRAALEKAVGRPVTDFNVVCCDLNGRVALFVGFGPETQAGYRPRPVNEQARLSRDLLESYRRFLRMLPEAVRRSGGAEDYSKGYALSSYPPLRTLQMQMRQAALRRSDEILRTLETSSDDQHRAAAAHLAGYAEQSETQIAALTEASRDPDETVRNNAMRALAVLASRAGVARRIRPEQFIQMLNSPAWSDRNKATMLLCSLTVERPREVLEQIGAGALTSLLDMAAWHSHFDGAFLLLRRLADLPE